MKALILKSLNEALSFEEMETPIPNSGEVQVKIHAAALNHRDVWIQKGQYAGIKYPIVLGSDGAGVVSDASDENLKHHIGKEVIINPSLNWGNNPNAQSKAYKILGLPDNGTFGEFVCVPVSQIQAKPSHLSMAEAAAIPLAGLTAWRALFSRAELLAGEKVLITGIGGGVALFAMQFAVALGAEVYVTSGSDDKIEKAVRLGAAGGANYKNDDWTSVLKQKAGGFDVIIDSAGGEGFNKLIDLANPGGRIAFYGGTHGAIPNVSPQKIFWKQLSLLGSTMGNDKEFELMIDFINKYNIVPVVDATIPIAEGQTAFDRMANGTQFGKIVLAVCETSKVS